MPRLEVQMRWMMRSLGTRALRVSADLESQEWKKRSKRSETWFAKRKELAVVEDGAEGLARPRAGPRTGPNSGRT